uniref:HDC12183 n=1 Tax=Drosophila melanogaster TaxID=7227 RepID=Q6IKL0_DROME|nr:TPA_inf: HDC12183 [Drosophila melanogaster]
MAISEPDTVGRRGILGAQIWEIPGKQLESSFPISLILKFPKLGNDFTIFIFITEASVSAFASPPSLTRFLWF